MAEIKMSGPSGLIILVDDDDLELVSGHKWYPLKAKGSLTIYARTSKDRQNISMHRLIMGFPKHGEVNHIDGNGLNNQRGNLEVVTHRQNIKAMYSRLAYDAWKREQNSTS